MKYLYGILVAIVVSLSASAVAAAQTPSPTATQTSVVPTATPSASPTPSTPPASSPSPVPSPTATPIGPRSGPGFIIRPTAPPPTTGIPVVDRGLSALGTDSVDLVVAQIHFVSQLCSGPQGISCPEGKPVGTLVSGVWVSSCGRGFIPAESAEVAGIVRGFLSSRQSLWAVTRMDLATPAQYEAFYSPSSVAFIDDQGITEFHTGCINDVTDLITATVGSSPQYVLGPGIPPFAPVTGSGGAQATPNTAPLVVGGVLILSIAVALVAATKHRRLR